MSQFLNTLRQRAFGELGAAEGHVPDLQGWVNPGFDTCLGLVKDRVAGREGLTVIEVGTWKGASASRIADALKPVGLRHLVCVDTWLGAPEFYTDAGLRDPTRGGSLLPVNGWPGVFHTFTRNMKALGHDDVVAPFPMSSVQAADVLRHHGVRADVIYVDAAHEYQAVKTDLEMYAPLARDVLWGDDFMPDHWPGVVRAVREFAESRKLHLEVHETNWILQLNKPDTLDKV